MTMSTHKKPKKGRQAAQEAKPPQAPAQGSVAPTKQPGKPQGKSPDEIKRILKGLIRQYGITVNKWDYLPIVLKQLGLDVRDATPERWWIAQKELEEANEKWIQDQIAHNAKGGRPRVVIPGHPELDPTKKKEAEVKVKESAVPGTTFTRTVEKPLGGKLSALDAAALVLGEEKRPMTAKELITLMEQRGYWKSPGGKTPDATLGAGIYKDIKERGEQSRFVRAGRGYFALA